MVELVAKDSILIPLARWLHGALLPEAMKYSIISAPLTLILEQQSDYDLTFLLRQENCLGMRTEGSNTLNHIYYCELSLIYACLSVKRLSTDRECTGPIHFLYVMQN